MTPNSVWDFTEGIRRDLTRKIMNSSAELAPNDHSMGSEAFFVKLVPKALKAVQEGDTWPRNDHGGRSYFNTGVYGTDIDKMKKRRMIERGIRKK